MRNNKPSPSRLGLFFVLGVAFPSSCVNNIVGLVKFYFTDK